MWVRGLPRGWGWRHDGLLRKLVKAGGREGGEREEREVEGKGGKERKAGTGE